MLLLPAVGKPGSQNAAALDRESLRLQADQQLDKDAQED